MDKTLVIWYLTVINSAYTFKWLSYSCQNLNEICSIDIYFHSSDTRVIILTTCVAAAIHDYTYVKFELYILAP